MTENSEFTATFESLKKIFLPYAKKLVLKNDAFDEFHLNTNFIMKNKNPVSTLNLLMSLCLRSFLN